MYRGLRGANARDEVLRLLDRVGLPDPTRRIEAYPHQMSGGQRQRVTIAMALSCAQDILLADEPTTALDVTIQGQILDLINELVEDTSMGLILISHDLGVIGETTETIAVMYGGTLVEQGATDSLFANLAHPYSQGLFAAIPRLGRVRDEPLSTILGTVPELADFPSGCAFADRCARTTDVCWCQAPIMVSPVITIGQMRGQGHERASPERPRCGRNGPARRRLAAPFHPAAGKPVPAAQNGLCPERD